MKELLIFRHAKAATRKGSTADRQRALTERGVADAVEIGQQLADEELLPDLVICSDAVRAVQTLESARAGWPAPPTVEMTGSLYVADGHRVFELLSATAGTADRVMVVGHNPALEEFVGLATGTPVTLKTGMVAVLKIDLDAWSEFDPSTGARLKSVISPSQKG